ncbi:MAG: hypothetical protein ACJ72D_05710 [Marmoricola sp.]
MAEPAPDPTPEAAAEPEAAPSAVEPEAVAEPAAAPADSLTSFFDEVMTEANDKAERAKRSRRR